MPLAWPNGLPFAGQRDAHRVPSLGLAPIRSPMQSGKVRQRPQFTLRITAMQVSILFTPAQLAVFHDFVRRTGEASAEFTMPVWVADRNAHEDRLVQIRNGAEGIAEEPHGVTKIRVTFTLDVRNL